MTGSRVSRRFQSFGGGGGGGGVERPLRNAGIESVSENTRRCDALRSFGV